jgi:cellulose synthase/poly-beta-1,6-N-acetylglucosamine synthase-like glycosyltransferase
MGKLAAGAFLTYVTVLIAIFGVEMASLVRLFEALFGMHEPFQPGLLVGSQVDPQVVLIFVLVSSLVILIVLAFEFVAAMFLCPSKHVDRNRLTTRNEQFGRVCVAVLTAFDDEEAIALSVDDFKRVPAVKSVIVVDNNSRDNTATVARDHGAIVVSEFRQGYGYACIAGLRYALNHTAFDDIILAEGDMTYYAQDLMKMLPYLEDCDLVVGTRTTRVLTQDGSQMDRFMVWGNMFIAVLMRLRFWDSTFWGRVRLTDVGCTFRAVRRESLDRIVDELDVGGNYFSPHMLIVALSTGLSVIEVPVKFRSRVGVSKGAGSSRLRALKIGVEMIWEVLSR